MTVASGGSGRSVNAESPEDSEPSIAGRPVVGGDRRGPGRPDLPTSSDRRDWAAGTGQARSRVRVADPPESDLETNADPDSHRSSIEPAGLAPSAPAADRVARAPARPDAPRFAAASIPEPPAVLTLPPHLRGQEALRLLPPATTGPAEMMFFGEAVESIDATGAVALRSAIEYQARHHHNRVTLSLPHDPGIRAMLHAMVRHDCPGHLVLPDDGGQHNDDEPDGCLVSARRVLSMPGAKELANTLLATATATRGVASFLGRQLPELYLNATEHGDDSPIDPIVAAMHSRESAEVQLVMADLGERGAKLDPDQLVARVCAKADGGLNALVDEANWRRLALTLCIASGANRVRWHGDRWTSCEGVPVAGFTVAISVSLQ